VIVPDPPDHLITPDTMRFAHYALLVVVLATASFGTVLNAVAQDPVDAQLARMTTLFTAEPANVLPGGYAELFAPSFRNAVPDAQLTAIFRQYWSQGGSVVSTETTSKANTLQGVFTLIFEKGIQVPVKTISVAPDPPHLITGLLLGLPEPMERAASLTAVSEAFAALPGSASFMAGRVGAEGRVDMLDGQEPEQVLALGSAFKLFVLGRLVADIEAGDRTWSDVVAFDPRTKSLPSGISQAWPDGAPVTLHTLATLMISISDNTATDLLVHTLGRDRVAAFQTEMGHTDASLNDPFLTTRELFVIKSDASMAAAYATAGPAARREILDSIADAQPDGASFPTSPTHIGTMEWFASAADMGRVLAWFTEDTPARAAARAIMAVNSGLDLNADTWRYIGYKGGSEPGVLTMSFLLQSRSGDWYVLTASQSDPDALVDQITFSSLMKQAARLLEAH
jgi:hypothetical protein